MTGIVPEVTDLLQQLIRNACVNDGTKESGEEVRSVDLLSSYLEGTGLDLERYEPVPGRASLVARIEGSDPNAPSLLLMGHTDVVPVNPERWRQDPFGGELVDGEVWGRGAVDMLNETSSMAVAFRRLVEEGFKPKGTLSYLAVADEEALGTWGADWLLENQAEAVKADYVVTEFGGFRMPLPSTSGPKLPIMVGEKGSYWCAIRVRGTPGHGSMPYRTDNALIKAAEVVRRIAAYQGETTIIDAWKGFVEKADLPPELASLLLDPARIQEFYETNPDVGLARISTSLLRSPMASSSIFSTSAPVTPGSVRMSTCSSTLSGMTFVLMPACIIVGANVVWVQAWTILAKPTSGCVS